MYTVIVLAGNTEKKISFWRSWVIMCLYGVHWLFESSKLFPEATDNSDYSMRNLIWIIPLLHLSNNIHIMYMSIHHHTKKQNLLGEVPCYRRSWELQPVCSTIYKHTRPHNSILTGPSVIQVCTKIQFPLHIRDRHIRSLHLLHAKVSLGHLM